MTIVTKKAQNNMARGMPKVFRSFQLHAQKTKFMIFLLIPLLKLSEELSWIKNFMGIYFFFVFGWIVNNSMMIHLFVCVCTRSACVLKETSILGEEILRERKRAKDVDCGFFAFVKDQRENLALKIFEFDGNYFL